MTKITKRFLDSLKPGDKDQYYWDSDLTGFGVRVKPSGHISFMVQYRNEFGRSRRMTIGKYGPLTPDEARKKARQELSRVLQGEDVVQIRQDKRQAPTMAELAQRYLVEHAQPKKKAWSVKQDSRLLDRLILPALGRHKVQAITKADIAKLHHGLHETPIQANRVLSLLSKMFNLAETWGLRPYHSNPCYQIEKYKENKRERYLTGDELSRLSEALTKAEAEEMPSAILAIRLLLFTGARVSEITTLKWEYVDSDIGVLRLPDSKTGAKIIPLPQPAIDLLRTAPRIQDNPFVCFGIKTGKHIIGLQHIWQRIRKDAGIEDVRLHDLRHSFASVAAAAGMGLPIIGAILGHSQPSTTQRYAHLALDPLKAATEEVAKRITEAMEKPPKRAKVINITERKK
jgi:integrase